MNLKGFDKKNEAQSSQITKEQLASSSANTVVSKQSEGKGRRRSSGKSTTTPLMRTRATCTQKSAVGEACGANYDGPVPEVLGTPGQRDKESRRGTFNTNLAALASIP